jgi:hypothetical protein
MILFLRGTSREVRRNNAGCQEIKVECQVKSRALLGSVPVGIYRVQEQDHSGENDALALEGRRDIHLLQLLEHGHRGMNYVVLFCVENLGVSVQVVALLKVGRR